MGCKMRSSMSLVAAGMRERAGAAVGLSAVLVAGAMFTPVYAQSSGSEPLDPVVVTGSRVRSPDQVSISPISAVTLDDVKLTGAIDIEQALRDIPQAFPGRGNTTDNNGNGDTSANLRNLGPQRTLVLVDGKRFVADDQKNQVDLDVIPPGMIERIDVVTGGASAVYGADAIAGVVNIVLRKNFNGLKIDGQYGAYGKPGGQTEDASLLAGSDFAEGRGNLTAYAGFTNREPVLMQDRSWAFPTLVSNGTNLVPKQSNVLPAGRDLISGLMFDNNGQLVPYDGSYFDRRFGEYIITPQRRFNLGFNGHYDVAPWMSLYFFGTFVQNNVDRSTPIEGITDQVSVNYGNPLLSAQERSILFAPGPHQSTDLAPIDLQKAFPSVGNDRELDTYNTYEFRMGLTGPIATHVTYDVSVQYGETDWLQVLTGDISPARFQQGLLVNPNGSCFDPSNGCVPIDIFTAASGAITAKQVNFFQLTQSSHTVTNQVLATGSVSGDLGGLGIESPLAGAPMTVALGSEYRRESVSYMPDDNLATGNNITYGAIPPEAGAYHVAEAFTEARLPLVQNHPWAKALELEVGYRYSDYNLAGKTGTYKYGGLWQPIDDVRFRGAFEHAVRAPSLDELFAPPQPNGGGSVDPCFSNNGAPPTASRALCLATGVPAAAYGSAALQCPGGSCEVLNGGNPALAVEKSNSVTFGVALTPRFVPGFETSIDYYRIDLRGAIAQFGSDPDLIIGNCYGTGAGQNPSQSPNNIYCQHVLRSPAGDIFSGGHNGSVGYVAMLNENTGQLSVSGVDLALRYHSSFQDLNISALPGSISVASQISKINSFLSQTDITSPISQCVGTFGQTCGQPIPRWRSNTRATWSPNEDLSLTVRWRFVDRVTLDADVLSGTITDPPDHKIPAISYFDLSANWRIQKKISLRASVLDLLDRQPPNISSNVATPSIFGFANTFPGTYDLGRTFFVGATVDF
jgi:iron complex outermembrane recepter protein